MGRLLSSSRSFGRYRSSRRRRPIILMDSYIVKFDVADVSGDVLWVGDDEDDSGSGLCAHVSKYISV